MVSLLGCGKNEPRVGVRLRRLFVAAAVLLWGVVAPGLARAGSITFQNVTFSMADLGNGQLQLTISNALNATGDWTGIGYLEAFSLKPAGGTYTGASLTGWNALTGGLSNGSDIGCNGSGAGFVCFYYSTVNPPNPPTYPAPLALTNNMIFTVQFVGGTVDFSTTHLKVDFWKSPADNCSAKNGSWDCKSTGSLLSKDIPVTAVPGPIVGAGLPGVLLACGGLLLLARRRRRLNALPA
jgi:hypothetical protein